MDGVPLEDMARDVSNAFHRQTLDAQNHRKEVAALHIDSDALRKEKDSVYEERNRVVALLASLFPSSLERHPDEDTEWEDDWRWIVFIDLPTGQVSWHIHDSQMSLFANIAPHGGRVWDGHTTEEKYARVSAAAFGDSTPSHSGEKPS